ncbi:S-adenosyl-L-methionine-dependent methyltransferase [Aspergillus lucknowensis]|uniref:S-adenosyl-L-methionine-dependent methyltransferase n=1 Tax=Aspergillus lucknowensis TaxID=176173 RepID=A0ABR4LSY0_9EURO
MATKDWSAQQYLKFEAERTRPSHDLLAQVPLKSPKRVVDLGCGPGNSTAVLRAQYPDAHLTGMDSSPDMIRKARTTLPNVEFTVEDLRTYAPQESVDVFFSNAVFQWLPRNERLQVIRRLMESQPSGGVFALQVPDNLTEPSHAAMRETAMNGPWAQTLSTSGRDRFQSPQEIYDELKPICADVNIWHTHYYHSLENHEAMVEWVKGTGLRPFIDPLSPADKDSFLKSYLGRLEQVYPNLSQGTWSAGSVPHQIGNSYQIACFRHGDALQIHYVGFALASSRRGAHEAICMANNGIPIVGPRPRPIPRARKMPAPSESMLPWVHPYLAQSVHPIKGRQLQASRPIQRGEVLLIDPPYAIIPTPSPASPVDTTENPLLCSNPQCNRPVPQSTGTPCANRCTTHVAWCDDTCRATDEPRHLFECAWLSKYALSLRSKWGEYNFGMLWLIVRILARRYAPQTEVQSPDCDDDDDDDDDDRRTSSVPPESLLSNFKSGWEAIESLCGTTETWSHAQIREWGMLVKKYLSKSSIPHNLSNSDILALICREEANSFGLYPRETGIFPPASAPVGRGEQFGAAVYPRASIANHSCCPNVIHKPDKQCRMVFTAGRDIVAGEECCISYFDMTQYKELKERREHLQGLFRFKCGCPRCAAEDVPDEGTKWDAFPGFE